MSIYIYVYVCIYTCIFGLKAATSVSRPGKTTAVLSQAQRTVPLAAHSSSIFINSWVQSAVAKPANPGHAKNLTRTQLRRLQCKYTQQSYVLMRNKLINLVRPLPSTALIAEQLEAFRATLYTGACEDKALQGPLEDNASVLIACNWCGTQMPMPKQADIVIIDE